MVNKGRILVVDDEQRNVKLLAAHLHSDGQQAITADNGAAAIELAASENPDVILLDIMMPGMDGYEVTRRLKEDPATQHIPVVLVTSLDGSGNRTRGLEAGADEFLSKPINRAELLLRVRALQRLKQMHDELQNRKQIVDRLLYEHNSQEVGRSTVLLVEDDMRLCRHICSLLEQEGCQAVIASSAEAARDVMEQYVPDLVLMDLLLPDGDGMALLDEWKAHETFVAVPVIIITALSDMEHKIEGLEHGADDYLIKPIENNELLARIHAGLRRSSNQQQLQNDIDRLKTDSVTDCLTGVRNRHYLEADLGYRFAQARRNPQCVLSVAMLDIDHFKHVNDQCGHLMGDAVLRQVAHLLQGASRTADIITRYGGEEFCIVMPETSCYIGQLVAERLRDAIEQHNFDGVSGQNITVSIGVASYSAEDADFADLLQRADQALYRAKHQGRNQVMTAPIPGKVVGG